MQHNALLQTDAVWCPNPTYSDGTSHKKRNFFCSHYNFCLDIAVIEKWQGFSCEKCHAYEPTAWDSEDRKEDEMKCMALVLTIFARNTRSYINPGRLVEWLESQAKAQQEFGGVHCLES